MKVFHILLHGFGLLKFDDNLQDIFKQRDGILGLKSSLAALRGMDWVHKYARFMKAN